MYIPKASGKPNRMVFSNIVKRCRIGVILKTTAIAPTNTTDTIITSISIIVVVIKSKR